MKAHDPWRKLIPDFCALDIAKANEHDNSACALGVARVVSGRVVATARWLVRPPYRRFRYKAIHGIRWRDVKTAPTLAELWPVVTPWLQGSEFIAAHAAAFHKRALLESLAREPAGAALPPFLCTMALMDFVWGKANLGLPKAARELKLRLRAKDSGSCACATAELLLRAWHEWYREVDCLHDLLECCAPSCRE
jgi:DNA polymerase-3 subunit epsilon